MKKLSLLVIVIFLLTVQSIAAASPYDLNNEDSQKLSQENEEKNKNLAMALGLSLINSPADPKAPPLSYAIKAPETIPLPQARPGVTLTPYEQIQLGAKQITVNELNTLRLAAYRRGIEPFIDALKKYCDAQKFPYSINLFNGKISFSYKMDNLKTHPLFQNTSFEYAFNTKTNNASVTIRMPNLEIHETLSASYTEAIPQNFNAFGFTLTPEPYLYAGHEGYIIKDLRPYSKAAIIGLQQYDQIIKIDNISITSSIDLTKTLKEINTALYKDKLPITITYVRAGNIEKTVLRP